MNAFEFLKKYQQLQNKVSFDRLFDLEYATINYSAEDTTSFCNFALTDKILSSFELIKIEQKMAELQRKPAVYFENRKDLELLKEFLTAKGYVRDYEDAWMFFWGGKVDKKRFHQVKEVKDESDLQVFIKIFDECYCINDPQNPYGEVKSWPLLSKMSGISTARPGTPTILLPTRKRSL